MSEAAIQTIRLTMVREGEPLGLVTQPVNVPDIARAALERMSQDRECFLVLHIDTRNIVTGVDVVSIGSLNGSLVHSREVFKAAILGNAAGLILVHNHPSGDITPSKEDVALTKRLVDAGRLLGIEVMDHVIIGDGYYSFKERGLLPCLNGSSSSALLAATGAGASG